jgi:cytochrome c-type biogenesis protein CcmF
MLAAAVAAALSYILAGGAGVLAPLGLALGVWLVAGALVDLAERMQLFRAPFATSLVRLSGLPRSALGTAAAHAGIGLCVIGIVSTTAYQTETIAALKPGDSLTVGSYTLRFEGTTPVTGPNYREERAQLVATRGRSAIPLAPAKRFYAAREMTTTEAAIATVGASQLYVSLGDRMDDGSVAIRASWKPLVTLIWLGPLLAAAGGALSLSDRRLRIGAPRRAPSRPAAASA